MRFINQGPNYEIITNPPSNRNHISGLPHFPLKFKSNRVTVNIQTPRMPLTFFEGCPTLPEDHYLFPHRPQLRPPQLEPPCSLLLVLPPHQMGHSPAETPTDQFNQVKHLQCRFHFGGEAAASFSFNSDSVLFIGYLKKRRM